MKKFFGLILALILALSLTTMAWGATAANATELQNAINGAAAGDNTITLTADITGDVTITQKEGVNITIDGAGKYFDGTIYINGNGRHTGAETLTIKNIKFKTATDRYFIDSNLTTSEGRYAHNVTIDNCSFEATTVPNVVVGMRFRQAYNIEVTNCTATNLFLVAWTTSNGPLYVENLTATGCIEGGISSANTSPVTVKNSTIKTTGTNGYGLRPDGDGAYTLNVEDSTIEAYIPIVVRKATANGYTVNVSGNNTMVAGNFSNTHIAVVSNNYTPNAATFTPATSSYTIDTSSHTGGTLNTKITDVVADGIPYDTVADAIASGAEKVYLNDGEYTVDLYSISEHDSLTIIGQGADTKLKFSNTQVLLSKFKKLTISNCTIERMPNKSWGHMVFASSDDDGIYTISDCIFNGANTQGIYINQNVPATFNIENCTFDGNFGKEGAVTIQNNKNIAITVNVNGCAFNNIPGTSHGIFALYEHGGWNLNVNNNVAAVNSAQLADAIANGVAEVYLENGEYTLPECTFTAPTGKQFKAWSVGGTEYNMGDSITISTPTTITATWTAIPSGGYYPVETPEETPVDTPEEKPAETKPVEDPVTPPAEEEVVTPKPEDTTPVVPDEPVINEPVVDEPPVDDAPQQGSIAVWVVVGAVAVAAGAAAIIIGKKRNS